MKEQKLIITLKAPQDFKKSENYIVKLITFLAPWAWWLLALMAIFLKIIIPTSIEYGYFNFDGKCLTAVFLSIIVYAIAKITVKHLIAFYKILYFVFPVILIIICSFNIAEVQNKFEENKISSIAITQTQTATSKPLISTEPIQTTNYTVKTEHVAEQSTEPIYEEYTFTAYCGCESCCGIWGTDRPDGIVKGAGNVELINGYHCASSLPFGTIVETETGEKYEVQDRTSKWVDEKYNGKIIDVYFDTHSQAVEFAKTVQKARIINDQ